MNKERRTWGGNSREEVGAEKEGEEELVLLKQGAADVAVEVVCEVVGEVAQSPLEVLGLGTGGDSE